jgi:hypothetical protein
MTWANDPMSSIMLAGKDWKDYQSCLESTRLFAALRSTPWLCKVSCDGLFLDSCCWKGLKSCRQVIFSRNNNHGTQKSAIC